MRAVYATDLSAASEAAIENETCLECLDRIGVESIHLVTVVPSNVHAGMPGVNFEERRRRGLDRYRNVMEGAGFAVETHVVRGTPFRRINGIADTVHADLTVVGLSVAAAVPAVLGVTVGQWLRKRVTQRTRRGGVFVLLALIGTRLLLGGLGIA